MQKHERTQTTRLRYAQLLSTGFRFALVSPDDSIIQSPEIALRHAKICRKANLSWPPANFQQAIENGRIRLGLFSKSDKIIGIGYYSEILDMASLAQGIFVHGLQLDTGYDAVEFAELTFAELADEFGYTFINFASPRVGWGRVRRPGWALKYSVWEYRYGQ